MDQMADEMTLRADLTDKGRVNTAEERGGKLMQLRFVEKSEHHYWVNVFLVNLCYDNAR